jgi:hypothetical protein
LFQLVVLKRSVVVPVVVLGTSEKLNAGNGLMLGGRATVWADALPASMAIAAARPLSAIDGTRIGCMVMAFTLGCVPGLRRTGASKPAATASRIVRLGL